MQRIGRPVVVLLDVVPPASRIGLPLGLAFRSDRKLVLPLSTCNTDPALSTLQLERPDPTTRWPAEPRSEPTALFRRRAVLTHLAVAASPISST